MRISLKLFATLVRHAAGQRAGAAFPLDLEKGASLGDVVTLLNLPAEEVKICFVNGRTQNLDFELHDGDEVGIFPPIGGG